ncbi:MAG: hypothetical protein KDK25_14855 [Leptospiraceae bacterium]|nr:hypothetical protein [Leptospiraceae bacterium]
MKRTISLSIALALLFSASIFTPVLAEDPPAEEEKKIDPMRECPSRPQQEALNNVEKENGLILEEQSWGNNPQESQYRSEVTRLLKLEIENVAKAVEDIEAKHKELIRLDRFSELSNYQEIVLEDNPGSWRNGIFVNSKKVLAMHYGPNGELQCLVLDSMERGVYNTSLWTRKVLRMYYPYIQTMELITRKQHYNPDPETLEKTSPEVQLQAFRLVFSNLRTALYSMDMMIAAYYDRRNKRNEWQIDL